MEGGESSQVSDSEGSGEPPKKGDICIDECGQAQVFDGNGWVPWRFVVTGTGQITPTDSPIDWVVGAWKTPFQAADDVAVLGFAKVTSGKNFKIVTESFLKNNGISDIHAFKQMFLGETAKLQYFEVAKHTFTHELLIIRKSTQEIIEYTGKYIK